VSLCVWCVCVCVWVCLCVGARLCVCTFVCLRVFMCVITLRLNSVALTPFPSPPRYDSGRIMKIDEQTELLEIPQMPSLLINEQIVARLTYAMNAYPHMWTAGNPYIPLRSHIDDKNKKNKRKKENNTLTSTSTTNILNGGGAVRKFSSEQMRIVMNMEHFLTSFITSDPAGKNRAVALSRAFFDEMDLALPGLEYDDYNAAMDVGEVRAD
jgi:hypothetical protein